MLVNKFLRALANTEVSVFAQDCDLRYAWVYNAGESWLAPAVEGMADRDILPAYREAARSAPRAWHKRRILQARVTAQRRAGWRRRQEG